MGDDTQISTKGMKYMILGVESTILSIIFGILFGYIVFFFLLFTGVILTLWRFVMY
jgi:hypothetical protein